MFGGVQSVFVNERGIADEIVAVVPENLDSPELFTNDVPVRIRFERVIRTQIESQFSSPNDERPSIRRFERYYGLGNLVELEFDTVKIQLEKEKLH